MANKNDVSLGEILVQQGVVSQESINRVFREQKHKNEPLINLLLKLKLAAEDKVFLKKVFKRFKDKIIVSVDSKCGIVAVKGWETKLKGVQALEFGNVLKKIGFKQVIYTDISKDGTLKGPNIKAIKAFLKETGLEVIGSGGISSLDDLRRLKLLEKSGLVGIIIGKALYEGKFTLPQALKTG